MCFNFFPLTRSVHTLSLQYFTHVNPVKYTLLISVKLRELEMVKSTLEVGTMTLLDITNLNVQNQHFYNEASNWLIIIGKKEKLFSSFERISTSLECTAFPVVTIMISK